MLDYPVVVPTPNEQPSASVNVERNGSGLPIRLVIGGLICRRERDGTEALAIIQTADARWSLPQRVLDAEHSCPKAALAKALEVPLESLKLGQVVHVGHNPENPNLGVLAYWYVQLEEDTHTTKIRTDIKWVSFKKAAKRLSESQDLSALHSHLALFHGPGGFDLKMAPISRMPSYFLCSPNRLRLLSELRRVGVRLAGYQFRWPQTNAYRAILLVFSKAIVAFRERDYEGGWKCLSDVRGLEFFLVDKAALSAQRIIVNEEGKAKLNGWRAEAFRQVMKKMEADESPELLQQAVSMISDSQETKFYSITLMQQQANLISLLLIFLAAAFLTVSFRLPDMNQSMAGISSGAYPIILVGSFLSGSIGACVSALLSFSQQQTMRVPDRMLDFITTLARPVIGGSSALMSNFFLMSGVIKGEQLTLAFLFVVGFAFGFSERLVISTVNRVSTK